MRLVTEEEVLTRLRTWANRYVSDAEAARRAKVTPAQMCDALSGKKPVPEKLLKKLRLQRSYFYVAGAIDDKYKAR